MIWCSPTAPPQRSRWRSAVDGALAVAAVLLLTVSAGCATSADGTGAGRPGDGEAFLQQYETGDGRIQRIDQGGDTVSEAQAYGMLIAVGIGDRADFDRIWSWTRRHLQRADHLLAWHWQDGTVADATPAADADLDAAVALLHAADVFGDAAYRSEGAQLADAVLAYETVPTEQGRLVVAGPWAVDDPATVNPGYLVAGTARYLARATGNAQWLAVATATAALDARLEQGYPLPPDWASVPDGGSATAATAAAAPDGSAPPQYGLDAVRLVIRLAASCSRADRALAADYLPRLGGVGAPGVRTLTGSATVTWQNPATDMALYASSLAAGDSNGAATALSAARAQQKSYPTYYGMAWIALAPLLFTSNLSETC